ncbi:hypothetical protein R3P38DRAFT_3237491 [Favolaschia claudopus]|uniref:Uncharacterized protein n=1 Tax=Favolaschia claudopus TaxID=2862362 RepID=A0AAV9ZB05_9AGAR
MAEYYPVITVEGTTGFMEETLSRSASAKRHHAVARPGCFKRDSGSSSSFDGRRAPHPDQYSPQVTPTWDRLAHTAPRCSDVINVRGRQGAELVAVRRIQIRATPSGRQVSKPKIFVTKQPAALIAMVAKSGHAAEGGARLDLEVLTTATTEAGRDGHEANVDLVGLGYAEYTVLVTESEEIWYNGKRDDDNASGGATWSSTSVSLLEEDIVVFDAVSTSPVSVAFELEHFQMSFNRPAQREDV